MLIGEFMALIKCKECGTDVSDRATTCVKCGAPIKAPKAKARSGCGVIVLGAIGVGVVVMIAAGSRNHSQNAASKSAEEACQKDDLSCLGDKGVVGAGVYCKDPVERLAKYSVKWTDGTFELKFSHFRWADQTVGAITYIGDKAEFQNGFGAWTPVTYECDMANDNKTVLDVRESGGRLPQ